MGAAEVFTSVLGNVAIGHGGVVRSAEDLDGNQARILLSMLLLHGGRVVSVDELTSALWPDGSHPASYRSALRNQLTQVRRLLGPFPPGVVSIDRVGRGLRLDVVGDPVLDLAHATSDAEALEVAWRVGDAAAGLRHGRAAATLLTQEAFPLVAGAWADAQRLAIGDLAARVLLLTGLLELRQGDPSGAERSARHAIVIRPAREDLRRLLMEALHAGGNRGAALREYEACRRMLSTELGVRPSPETEEVHRRILDESGQRPLHRRANLAAGRLHLVQHGAPFVGREAMVDVITAELARAHRDGARVVTVSGEAGAGKTRLGAEMAAIADRRGMTVLYGRADEEVRAPYDAFVEATAPLFVSVDASEVAAALGPDAAILARHLPALAEVVDPSDPVGIPQVDRLHTGLALIRLLAMGARDDGLLVIIDDVQWANSSVLSVIEQLAVSERPEPVVLLLLDRGSDDRVDMREIPDRSRVTRLTLAPLTEADVGRLVEWSGQVALPASAVWRVGRGNALVTTQLIRRGDADADHDAPEWRSVIERRIDRATAEVRGLLCAAAVAGVEFAPSVVATAAYVPRAEANRLFDQLTEEGLVTRIVARPDRMEWTHSLVRAVVLDGVDPVEQARLHGRLAEVIANEPSPDGAALAFHHSVAGTEGNWRRAVGYAVPVARTALEAGVYDDAITVTTRALAALAAAGGPSPEMRRTLQLVLGAARCAQGEPEGPELLRELFEEARALGDARLLAEVALAFNTGGVAGAEAFFDDSLLPYYEAALEAIGTSDLTIRAQLLGHLATANAWRLSGEAAGEAADEALALADGITEPIARLDVLSTTRRAITGGLQLDRQAALEDRLLRAANHLDDPGGRVRVGVWRFTTELERGEGSHLEALLDAAEQQLPGLTDPTYRYSVTYSRAALALLRGDLDLAGELTQRAADLPHPGPFGPLLAEGVRLIQTLGLRLEQGRLDEVRDELLAFPGFDQVPEWRGAIAVVDAHLGRFDDIAANLAAFFDGVGAGTSRISVGYGFIAFMATAVHAIGDRGQAELLHRVLAPYTGCGGYLGIFGGPIDYALGLTASTLGRLDEADRHFAAAVEFSRRLGSPRWVERCAAGTAGIPRA